MMAAIEIEIQLQSHYLSESIETIYFGGGTPSLLDLEDLQSLMETIQKHTAFLPTLK